MINIFFIFLIILFFILLCEIILRFRKLKYIPLKFRMLYCCFLLNKTTFIENYVISQRVHRGGFKYLSELIKYYSMISGLTTGEIYKKFILSFNNSQYYSGAHGTLEKIRDDQHGSKPLPKQKLQTITINENGYRNTVNIKSFSNKKEKKIFFLGGSTMFGAGASSDSKTIPSLVSSYLNNNINSKFNYKCYNYAYLNYDISDELIILNKISEHANIIVSLNGYNEVSKKLFINPKKNQNHILKKLNIFNTLKSTSMKWNSAAGIFSQILILRSIKRFYYAYKYFNLTNKDITSSFDNRSDIYPLF